MGNTVRIPEGPSRRTNPEVDRAKRLLNFPVSLWNSPACWKGWILIGGVQRRHILGYTNEHEHTPPWVERQLYAEAEQTWTTRP